jgi:hypothetical protein
MNNKITISVHKNVFNLSSFLYCYFNIFHPELGYHCEKPSYETLGTAPSHAFI